MMKKYSNKFGFTFIELIVSLLLLSIVVLGLDAMETVALRQAVNAWHYHIANNQLVNMADRIKSMNKDDLNEQVQLWDEENNHLLPNAKGSVRAESLYYVVQICFDRNKNCLQEKVVI